MKLVDTFEEAQEWLYQVEVEGEMATIDNKAVELLIDFFFTATDSDEPANILSYALAGAPTDAHLLTIPYVKIVDNGSPALSDEEGITVTVNEVNVAPVFISTPVVKPSTI